ncbi:MAG TPA: acetylxylan esterase [Planctomycetota bacterium]|nr:acetylxylan esterase [Planctomycetota bacterium]
MPTARPADDAPVRLPHPHPFDPAYGYGLAALRAIAPPDEVAGFAPFWRGTYEACLATPLRLEVGEPLPIDGDRICRIVRFDTFAGHRIGAWWTMPADGVVEAGVVAGHGYGGRSGPGGDWAPPRAAEIAPCAPGFDLSAAADLPATSDRHVVHGIASRDTYLIRACVAATWSAASALLALAPDVGRSLWYAGGSFGGGLGALALPWDARFARACLIVPTFGHHPLRLRCPCVGSGESVRRHAAAHPEVVDVLAYYDAAVAARRIAIPTVVVPARFDPAVPPPGQFAVANAIAGARVVPITAGHHDNPDEVADQRAVRAALTALAASG